MKTAKFKKGQEFTYLGQNAIVKSVTWCNMEGTFTVTFTFISNETGAVMTVRNCNQLHLINMK